MDNIFTTNKKVCACKNCKNIATTVLEVKHIQKVGQFCKSCTQDLLQSGLVLNKEKVND